jgi:NADPH:quinone reductase-like Zn-dependent oxidoreductase
MRQVWIPRKGGPEVLEVRDGPVPEPKRGEVRIRVAAAGVNFADILIRMGLYPGAPRLPAVVGYEVAGEIDRLGAGVDDLGTGDRVVALTPFGGYSEHVTVPRPAVFPLPPELEYAAAAALPVNYLTAWVMLVRLGNVRAGERVLVHGAAGGVGQAALQICRWRGAEVLGTASAAKHQRLRELGVAHCIDYRNDDFETAVARITGKAGVDIVLDPIGGATSRKSYRCLAPLGRLFLFGASSFAPGKRPSRLAMLKGLWRTPRFHALDLIGRSRGVFGVHLGQLGAGRRELPAMMHDILALVADGTFAPVVDRTFAFAEAGDAHDYIQSRRNFGKVVLVP